MNLSRRGFLTGLLSTAAVISAGPVAKIVEPVLDVYGVSPGLRAVQDYEFLEGMSQRIVATMIYGIADVSPVQFTGLKPFYNANSKRTGNVLDGGLDDPRTLDWKTQWVKAA